MDTPPTIRTSNPAKSTISPTTTPPDGDLEELRHGPHHNAPRSTHPTAEAGHFTRPRVRARRGTSPRPDARDGPARSRTATEPPRPPRELPKASSKRRAPTEPRTVATERAQYGHPTVPALDLTARIPRPAAGRPARPRRTSPPPPVRSKQQPTPHQNQKAQQRAKSWPEGTRIQTSPTKTDRKNAHRRRPSSSCRNRPRLNRYDRAKPPLTFASLPSPVTLATYPSSP